MLIYDQRNFDLHLTQLNCAIANWATIIRIICRPTQMLLAFATGRPLILIPVYSYFILFIIYYLQVIYLGEYVGNFTNVQYMVILTGPTWLNA